MYQSRVTRWMAERVVKRLELVDVAVDETGLLHTHPSHQVFQGSPVLEPREWIRHSGYVLGLEFERPHNPRSRVPHRLLHLRDNGAYRGRVVFRPEGDGTDHLSRQLFPLRIGRISAGVKRERRSGTMPPSGSAIVESWRTSPWPPDRAGCPQRQWFRAAGDPHGPKRPSP